MTQSSIAASVPRMRPTSAAIPPVVTPGTKRGASWPRCRSSLCTSRPSCVVYRGPRGEKIYPQQKGPYKRRVAEEGDATVEEIKGVRVSTWLEGRAEVYGAVPSRSPSPDPKTQGEQAKANHRVPRSTLQSQPDPGPDASRGPRVPRAKTPHVTRGGAGPGEQGATRQVFDQENIRQSRAAIRAPIRPREQQERESQRNREAIASIRRTREQSREPAETRQRHIERQREEVSAHGRCGRYVGEGCRTVTDRPSKV